MKERKQKKKGAEAGGSRVEDFRLLLSSSSVISKHWNQDGRPDRFYDSGAESLLIIGAIIPSTGALGPLEPCTQFRLLSEEGAIWQAHCVGLARREPWGPQCGWYNCVNALEDKAAIYK